MAKRYYTCLTNCIKTTIHKVVEKKRKNIMNEIVKEEKKETEHRWKCANTPGQYICVCGATGLWNRSLQKIEVEFPMPYELMKSRHLTMSKAII